jgi:lipid-binding SYLF domain-containing protein
MTTEGSPARAIAAIGLIFLAGCTGSFRRSVPSEQPAMTIGQAKEEVRAMARDALQDLYAENPAAKKSIKNASGYAVFSSSGMKVGTTGSATGSGIAFRNPKRQEIFMEMQELQAGSGSGIDKFRQVWIFQSQAAFDSFVNKGFEFGGQATGAVTSDDDDSGVAGAASISPAVLVYQLTDEGLSAEPAGKGARYRRDGKLN